MTTRPSKMNVAAALLCSVLLCTIHYFGIICWGLVTAGHLAFLDDRRRLTRWAGVGLASGPLMLGVCLMIFYPGQRSALSVPTWIARPSPSHVYEFLASLFPAILFAIPGLIALFDALIRDRFGADQSPVARSSQVNRVAGASSLILLPLVILAFTYLVQPATLARYAIPTVVCVGPIVAFALRSVSRVMADLAAASLLLLATANFGVCWKAYERYESFDTWKAIEAIRSQQASPDSVLILSGQREIAYQAWKYAPALSKTVRVVDPIDLHSSPLSNFDRFEQDLATRLHQLYEMPDLIRLADASSAPTLYIIAASSTAETISARFPGYERELVYDHRITCWKLSKKSP